MRLRDFIPTGPFPSAMLLLGAIVLGSPAASALAQWQAATAFSTPREFAAGLVLDGRIYAVGGSPWQNGGDLDGAVHSWAPGESFWRNDPALDGMGPFVGMAAGIDSVGRIVAFGGHNIDNGDRNDGIVYDLVEGPRGSIAPRDEAAPDAHFAFATDDEGRLYSLGGGLGIAASSAAPNSTHAERYDADADAWEILAPLPIAVADAAAVNDARGHILVLGGYDATAATRLATVQRYDIATNSWSAAAVADLPETLSNHTAVLGADGRVYVIGGLVGPVGDEIPSNHVYVLDPASGTWTTGPSLQLARYDAPAVLALDDHLYVLGGTTSPASGTASVERLYTTPCPVFSAAPSLVSPWRGNTAVVDVTVTGGVPMTLQWHRDGSPVADGPTGFGSILEGTATTHLVVRDVTPDDAGTYTLEATNSCGQAVSPPIPVEVRVPPAFPATWTVVNLHPAWANSSRAVGVDGDTQAGSSSMAVPPYATMERPTLWHGAASSAVDLTPAGSVGGSISGVGGDFQVGWWWWPYDCRVGTSWETCYTKRACSWNGSAASHVSRPVSGYEYSVINGTDGTSLAGTGWYDDAVGNLYRKAGVWTPPYYSFHAVDGSGTSAAYAYAVDGDRVFGIIHTPFPGPQVHAAAWTLGVAGHVDMNPPGSPHSSIVAAADGQQVGSVGFYTEARAALWAGAPETLQYLDPNAATTSRVTGCGDGLQVGSAVFDTGLHAVVWAGTAEEYVDLHDFVGPDFASSTAADVDVAPDGRISVVGSGYNSITQREEALLWLAGAEPAATATATSPAATATPTPTDTLPPATSTPTHTHTQTLTATPTATAPPATATPTPVADGDGDGVPDIADNCPVDSNATQANIDGDAEGDACDVDDVPLSLSRAVVRSRGAVAISADFVRTIELDATAGMSVTITDPNGVAGQHTWEPGACRNRRGRVTCRDANGRLSLMPRRKPAGEVRVRVGLRGLPVAAAASPLEVVVSEAATRIDHRGTIDNCRTARSGLSCRRRR